MTWRYEIPWAALGLLGLVIANECTPAEAQQPWTAAEVIVARHCISEASGAQTDDCRAIAWIDMTNASRRGMTIEAWMSRAHSRHLRSRTRPWLADLSADMHEPAGWPQSVSWERRGRPAWEATLGVVRSVLDGDGDHGCSAAPSVWGGPGPDRERLARMLANGWERVDCGNTRNWFIRRVR